MADLLQVENVSKSFGGLSVSRDVSFSLKPGDRTGLIGPNGAGKTTLINLISGILKPDSGTFRLNGVDVTKLGMVERSRLGLVRSFQISRLFRDLTVFENVTLPMLQKAGHTSRILSTSIDPQIAEEATQILTRLGIGAAAGKKAGSIAYGEQRLVELAMVLAMRPRVLLLDEPAAGAGGNEAARILQAIEQLPAEIAILLIDHDMELVFRFAKRVIVLAEGAVIFEGPSREVAKNESVRKAYLGSFAHGRSAA